MVFNKLGGIYYDETYEVSKLDYGGSIPCFIGRTINLDYLYAEEQKKPEGETKRTREQIKTEVEANRKLNQLILFNNFTQANRNTLDADGKMEGLGDYETEKEQNPLLKFVHDFCEETKMMTEEYVACPYFYVIDLGCADTLPTWINATEVAKTKREIDFEVYIGFDNVMDKSTTPSTVASYESFILAVNYDLVMNRQVVGDFRKAFYTLNRIDSETKKYQDDTYYKNNYKDKINGELIIKGTDSDIKQLAKDITGMNNTTNGRNNVYDSYFTKNADSDEYLGTITNLSTNTISKSRTYICEPLHFGHTVGRISITPYDMEPGYYEYNTLTIDDIILRKPNEQLQLQMAGVIFNHLEETSVEEYVKINRTQSVSSNLTSHPPDSLFQARNLCDELLTRIFDTCYPQLKNKETETNLGYLQTQINKVVNDAIVDGDFIGPYTVGNERKGTLMSVQESMEDAYDIELVGMLQPVNCTYTIHIVAKINDAKIQVIEK